MFKNSISCLIIYTCLISCSTYQLTSIPLDQAVDKGKVKAVTNRGYEDYYSNIVREDGLYFGIKGKQRIQLNELAISELYLSSLRQRKAHEIWIKPIGSSTRIRGFLFAVKDSSIIIIAQPVTQESESLVDQKEFQIDRIDKIYLRQEGRVLRGYAKGTLAGIGLGATAGLILGSQADEGGGFTFIIMGIGAGMVGILGSIVGVVSGSSKERFVIQGNLDEFNNFRNELISKSIQN